MYLSRRIKPDKSGLIRPNTTEETRMRTASIIAALLLTTAANADTVILTGGGWDIASPAPPRPYDPDKHALLFWNEFSVDVVPNQPTQTFQFPLETLPESIRYGLGNWTAPIENDPLRSLGPNRRVRDLDLDHLDLTLNYWVYTPLGTAWNVGWAMVGTGTIVPEPSGIALLLPIVAFAARRKR
jgi:hypothetical protein